MWRAIAQRGKNVERGRIALAMDGHVATVGTALQRWQPDLASWLPTRSLSGWLITMHVLQKKGKMGTSHFKSLADFI
jgi:hypothetical protein